MNLLKQLSPAGRARLEWAAARVARTYKFDSYARETLIAAFSGADKWLIANSTVADFMEAVLESLKGLGGKVARAALAKSRSLADRVYSELSNFVDDIRAAVPEPQEAGAA
ncbi:MAG: hypothetical protein OEY28_00075 [Nitrospira sp.]|nr:hypothetical protein [Nitrospira sp.]